MEWKAIKDAPVDTPIKVYDPTMIWSRTLPILCKWDGHGWRRLDRRGFIGMYLNPTHYVDIEPPNDRD